MYKVWSEDGIDRYYKNYEKAYEACRNFILNSCFNYAVKQNLLLTLDSTNSCELCGIEEIKLEDEISRLVRSNGKKKYKVTFVKYETIEVEAHNEDEAEELADDILSEDAYAWEGPADRIEVKLMED